MAAGRLSGFPVLAYHGVSPGTAAPAVAPAELKYWVAAPELRAQLAEIRRAGARVTGLGEAWHPAKTLDGPEPPVVVTFDDGQVADYEASFPLLLEAGARAEFFVNTANIGRPGFLNWGQIAEMQRSGMSFQSHSHDHVDLSRLPGRALEYQIRESKQRLENGLGTAVEFLAAPYGLLDRRVLDVAREQGYRAVCTSRAWPACPGAPTIGRIAIHRHTRPGGFRRIVTRHPVPYLLRAIRVALIYLPKRVLLRYRPRRLGVRVLARGAGMTRARRLRIFVLIDALGWTYVEDSRFLADLLPYRTPLRTFLGYSSGAVPSILTGVPPARHGHWNLFYRDPAHSPFRWLRALRFLPDAALNHRVTRKLLKEMGRRLLGLGPLFECAVSPRLLPELDWIEKRNIYAPGGIPGTQSIFDFLADQRTPHRVYSYHQWTDAEILRQAGKDIESSDATFFFLYLCEMDALLHSQCQDPAAWQGRLEWYAQGLQELLSAARRVDPDATLTVFSDHGMTPVRHHYDLATHVGRLGLKMPDDYLAVYDSTMARFWFFSDRARAQIMDRLHTVPCGHVLSNDELRDLGVFFPDRRYGEVVFLLKPGWLLSNSDFNGNGWRPAGMHGYHPDDSYSHGICLSTHKSEVELRTIADAYRCMREAVPADTAMEGQHAP